MLALAAIPVATLVVVALRRPKFRVFGPVAGSGADVARALLEAPACQVEGVLLREIVELDDDVLLSYNRGVGSRCTADAADLLFVDEGGPDGEGQLVLPRLVRDARAMALVQRWCAKQTPLIGVISGDGTLGGLVDRRDRKVVVARLASPR